VVLPDQSPLNLEFEVEEDTDVQAPQIKAYLIFIKYQIWEGVDQKTNEEFINFDQYEVFKDFLSLFFTTTNISSFWEKFDSCDDCQVSDEE
jgi:hypothetical protein